MKKTLISTLFLILNFLLVVPAYAQGESAFYPKPTCSDGSQDWSCANIAFIEELIRYALKGFIAVFTAIAVLMIVIGGYYYLTAYGNEEKATKGKNTILWAIVGLVVAALAWWIVAIVWQITAGGVPAQIAPPT